MPEVISAAGFTDLLRPGMRVYIQGSTGEPLSLVDALAENPDAARGVEFLSAPLPGFNRFDPAALHPEASMTTLFMNPELRRSPARGRIRFIPLHYSGMYRFLSELDDLDMMLAQVAGEVRDGQCSFGLTVEHAAAALNSAKTIVVEKNAAIPFTACDPMLPWERIDYVIETDRPAPEFPSPPLTPVSEALGKHAASVIRDGDCLQIGIGRLMSAAMRQLEGHKDLGFHSGLISDETQMLVEAGALTGRRKNVDTGRIVAGAVFGSRPLHAFATDPSVLLAGTGYTHEPPLIARIDNFLSINAAMTVDLYGQVVADNIGGKQISSPGGFSDFQRAARLSKGGRSLVLLQSTNDDGTRSNILPKLPAGAVVTGVRGDTDIVVTEHGSADLRLKDMDAKAAALIEIAAPRFREELEKAWRETPW